jgi:hypothetical protein
MSYSLLHLQILICFQRGDSFTCISPEEMGKQVLPITSSILNLKYLFKMHNMLVSQLPWRALYLSTDYVNGPMFLSCPLHLHFALLCQCSYMPLLRALSGLKNTVNSNLCYSFHPIFEVVHHHFFAFHISLFSTSLVACVCEADYDLTDKYCYRQFVLYFPPNHQSGLSSFFSFHI